MSLTIQQIEKLAQDNLRQHYQQRFWSGAFDLYHSRDLVLEQYKTTRLRGLRGHTRIDSQVMSAAEAKTRSECRVALAALFAKLYAEQEGHNHESGTETG